MAITDVIALSLLGLVFWMAPTAISSSMEEILKMMPTPPAKIRTSIKSQILVALASAMVFAPWLLMVISVAQRVIA
jgi:hypothetical protein